MSGGGRTELEPWPPPPSLKFSRSDQLLPLKIFMDLHLTPHQGEHYSQSQNLKGQLAELFNNRDFGLPSRQHKKD